MAPEDPEHFQLALALSEQQPEILKKPVQAIHMAITGGQQNKTQRLAFNAMLKHALEEHAKNPLASIETYSISRVDLMRTIDYTSPNRKHLKDALTQMQKLTVQWDFLKQDGDAMWASCVLLPFIGFDRDKVYYSYAPHIKAMLFESKIYARLDLRIQRRFRLDCAAALYEWVNRFRTNPSKMTNEMPWQDWRWVIYGEIQESSVLVEYKMFKREKLKPAMLEINEKSDLHITLFENKDGGRSVKFLQFEVTEKAMFKVASDEEVEANEWNKKLEDLGVTARDRKKILSKFSPEVIDAHYRYTMTRLKDKAQKPLTNVVGYFKNAIEANYAVDLIKTEAGQPAETLAMKEIESDFMSSRNQEAEAMFNEMMAADQEAEIGEYNALQTVANAKVPAAGQKRLKRHMAGFFIWFAKKTWGEPSSQEIFDFALRTGAIKLNKG